MLTIPLAAARLSVSPRTGPDPALPFTLLRIERVMEATDFGRSKIAELLDPVSPRYDPTFPKPRKAGARALRWRSDELAAWMAGLPVAGSNSTPTSN